MLLGRTGHGAMAGMTSMTQADIGRLDIPQCSGEGRVPIGWLCHVYRMVPVPA
jgi:hypothetical protein